VLKGTAVGGRDGSSARSRAVPCTRLPARSRVSAGPPLGQIGLADGTEQGIARQLSVLDNSYSGYLE